MQWKPLDLSVTGVANWIGVGKVKDDDMFSVVFLGWEMGVPPSQVETKPTDTATAEIDYSPGTDSLAVSAVLRGSILILSNEEVVVHVID